MTATVRLRGERRSRHPWVWRKMIQPAQVAAGSVVRVAERNGAPVGTGFYNPGSEIAVRLLSTDSDVDIDAHWIGERIARARQLREGWLQLPAVTDAWRLCNAEGDGCSGLIIDRYADHLLVQCHALGWHRLRGAVEAALRDAFPDHAIHWRADARAAKREGFPVTPVAAAHTVVREGACSFEVDLAGGHKTGFFCDQRENRLALAELVAGRRLLDVCCYTGGFALHAAPRAASVTAIDLDEAALAIARRNGERNGAAVEWVHADAFDWFRSRAGEQWDVVVVDPPGWGKVKAELAKAQRQYTDLNRYAIQAVAPGGLLVTCCCAGLVSEDELVSCIRDAARAANRELQVWRITGAGADHPVPLDFPEGRYLTVIWARVS